MESLFDRLSRIISQVTYKPGWKLSVADGPAASIYGPRYSDMCYLTAMWVAKDVITGDQIYLTQVRPVDDLDAVRMTDAQIIEFFVSGLIRAAELHEMDEWFKVDGICFRDPHPERKEHAAHPSTPSL